MTGNLGRIDRALRVVLALGALVVMRLVIGIEAEASLAVVLSTFLAVGYLLLTAGAGNDIVYAMLDIDTVGKGLHFHRHQPRPWHH